MVQFLNYNIYLTHFRNKLFLSGPFCPLSMPPTLGEYICLQTRLFRTILASEPSWSCTTKVFGCSRSPLQLAWSYFLPISGMQVLRLIDLDFLRPNELWLVLGLHADSETDPFICVCAASKNLRVVHLKQP